MLHKSIMRCSRPQQPRVRVSYPLTVLSRPSRSHRKGRSHAFSESDRSDQTVELEFLPRFDGVVYRLYAGARHLAVDEERLAPQTPARHTWAQRRGFRGRGPGEQRQSAPVPVDLLPDCWVCNYCVSYCDADFQLQLLRV